MSKSKKELQKAISSISTNVNVGMEEVVNVFVSRYETDLIVKKDELQSELVGKNKQLKDLDVVILNGVKDVERQSLNFGEFDMSMKHTGTDLSWEDNKNVIKINFKMTNNQSSYSDSITPFIEINICDNDVRKHTLLKDEVAEIATEMGRVKGLLKDVGRKERQIKGEISARKLEESGFSSLLDDSKLLELCNF